MLTNPRRRIRSDSTLLSFCSRLDSKATSIRHHSIAILSFPWDSGIREGADPDLVKVTHQLQPTPRGQRLVRLLFENLIDRSAGTESTVVQREHCAHLAVLFCEGGGDGLFSSASVVLSAVTNSCVAGWKHRGCCTRPVRIPYSSCIGPCNSLKTREGKSGIQNRLHPSCIHPQIAGVKLLFRRALDGLRSLPKLLPLPTPLPTFC